MSLDWPSQAFLDARAALEVVQQELGEAVCKQDYAVAADKQAKEQELKRTIATLVAEYREQNYGDTPLCHARVIEEAAARVYHKQIEDALKPLETCMKTTLAIVHQGMRLAAARGCTHISIHDMYKFVNETAKPASAPAARARSRFGAVPNASVSAPGHPAFGTTPVQPPSAPVFGAAPVFASPTPPIVADEAMKEGYVIRMGLVSIPVLANINDDQIVYLKNRWEMRSCMSHSKADSAHLIGAASTFDAKTMHAYGDLKTVLSSQIGCLSLQWRLHEAGYCSHTSTSYDDGNRCNLTGELLRVACGTNKHKIIDNDKTFNVLHASLTFDEFAWKTGWSSDM